ncbi:thioesterase II family protein [Nocardia harenae]|uniref:thioesterase II family protein n=1 Tax=Nocardia harenae TaxID=358707 RepID=UPI0008314E80|nr:alpha/beta fold hydrolase [Nocardia harenae]
MNASAIDIRRWMPYPPAGSGATALYCLPHAGAGASAYLPWRRQLAPGVDVVPLQPPGREIRLREKPFEHIDHLLDDLVAAMDGHWREPFAVYGHSLGALLAYELTRRLLVSRGPRPVRLLISGRRAPHLPSRLPPLRTAPESTVLDVVRALGGTPDEILGDDRMRRSVLALMRADLSVDQSYRYQPGPPLALPITVFGGSGDTHVLPAELLQWSEYGVAGVDIRMIPGGHFFPITHQDAVIGHIRHSLGSPA